MTVAQDLCRADKHAMRLASSVSKSTKCLISAQGKLEGNLSRKYRQATELGITIVESEEGLALLRIAFNSDQ